MAFDLSTAKPVSDMPPAPTTPTKVGSFDMATAKPVVDDKADPGFLISTGEELLGVPLAIGHAIRGAAGLAMGGIKEVEAIPARIKAAAGKGPEVHTPMGDLVSQFMRAPGRTIAEGVVGAEQAGLQAGRRLTTKPTTRKERMEFGETVFNVLTGAKGLYEAGRYTIKLSDQAKAARNARIRESGKMGADEAKRLAAEHAEADVKAAQTELNARLQAIKDEHARAIVEAEQAEIAAQREAEHDAQIDVEAAKKEAADRIAALRANEGRQLAAEQERYRQATAARSVAAQRESGLPPADVDKPGWKGGVGRDLRASVLSRFREALRRKRDEGGAAWAKYETRAKELESSGQIFAETKAGRGVLKELDSIADVDPNQKVTAYAHDFRRMANRVREKLKGALVEDAEGNSKRVPLSMEALDEELRMLRALENRTDLAGADVISRGRAKKLADTLERGLKEWVGEENYPREYYANVSKEFNRFDTKLLKSIVEREDIDYIHGTRAPFKNSSQTLTKLFENPENARELRATIGNERYDELMARHVSNSLYGMDAPNANRWLTDNASWLKSSPSAFNQATDYAAALARQEMNLKAMDDAAAFAKKGLQNSRSMLRDALKDIRKARETKITAAPEQLMARVRDAEKARETAVGEARTKAEAQYKDARKQYEDAITAAAERQKASQKLADSIESFMVGHKPETMVAKFDQGIAAEMRAAGIDEGTIEMMRQQVRQMDKYAAGEKRKKYLKMVAGTMAATLLGYKAVGVVSRLGQAAMTGANQ